MDTWNISPRFKNDKLASGAIDDQIDVFADQVSGWLLVHARALCAVDYPGRTHSGFAVLLLLGSYFEMIESFHRGESSEGHSKAFFRAGFLRVFHDLEGNLAALGLSDPPSQACRVADEFYDQVRCGLYHEALVKSKMWIRQDNAPVGIAVEKTTGEVGAIVIDPWLFAASVAAHFDVYIAKLRTVTEEDFRRNFQQEFSRRQARPWPVIPPAAFTNPAGGQSRTLDREA